jgi:hypothetical protein
MRKRCSASGAPSRSFSTIVVGGSGSGGGRVLRLLGRVEQDLSAVQLQLLFEGDRRALRLDHELLVDDEPPVALRRQREAVFAGGEAGVSALEGDGVRAELDAILRHAQGALADREHQLLVGPQLDALGARERGDSVGMRHPRARFVPHARPRW